MANTNKVIRNNIFLLLLGILWVLEIFKLFKDGSTTLGWIIFLLGFTYIFVKDHTPNWLIKREL